MEISESKVLYQETNPYSSMTAFLEDDGRTIYLYLQSQFNDEYRMQSVWVRNRVPAPTQRKKEDFHSGLAPILCSFELEDKHDTSPINPEDIHFIWLEEGNGVALFEKEELISFLPPWSGIKNFHGYSKYLKTEAITAYPLGDPNNGPIIDRINSARNFWEFRASKQSWSEIRDSRLEYLENEFQKHTMYWSADGGKFPFVGIAKFRPKQYPNISIYSTIGMSAQNMPNVELYHRDYEEYSRIEMVFAVYEPEGNISENWAPHFMGEVIKYPWSMLQWFGAGHTISLTKKDPFLNMDHFTHLLFMDKVSESIINKESYPAPQLNSFISENGYKVNFLFSLPIIEEERCFILEKGYHSLLESAKAKGIGWVHVSNRDSIL